MPSGSNTHTANLYLVGARRKAMTIKERMMRRVEKLDETKLLKLEREIDKLEEPTLSVEEELHLWNKLAGTLSDPEDEAAFKEASGRRSLFRII